ncbi:MAG: hypothetical protein Ct9H90mP30_1200 [Actinomycetota bacterium]|nr:MAG: hypothetical protein Ct9H90mP30_1200 [Actinomycetota bacterium]
MSFSMNEQEFDEVIAVHLKGHFVCARQLLSTGGINLRQEKTQLEE